MNKREVDGAAREAKGKIEQGVGKVTGNEHTQAHGKTEELKGKVTKDAGHLQGKVENAKDAVKEKVQRATK